MPKGIPTAGYRTQSERHYSPERPPGRPTKTPGATRPRRVMYLTDAEYEAAVHAYQAVRATTAPEK